MSHETGRSQVAPVPGSDELLRLIVESATDFAIFSMDTEGLITSWNVGAERLLGFAEPEILGHCADVIFPPEEGGSQAAARERELARTEGRAEDERWHNRKDGSRFWASGLLMPLSQPGAGFVKILRDRTARHQAELRIRENEERFRLLATNIPQLVFTCRPDGKRTWGSPQWTAYSGLELEESLELRWLDAVHPEDREATIAGWREARDRGRYYVEHRLQRGADGAYRWHQTRAQPIDGALGESDADWIGTMTDVHDLRGLQDRQEVLMAELQHRTRNLLAVVQSLARQTRRSSPSLQVFGGEFERRLAALGRVQALLVRVDHQDVDLRELVEAELSAHGTGDGDPGRIAVEGPSVALPANAAQTLGLALHELATNAVKYGALSQQAAELEVVWRILADGRQPWVALEWRETGVEMPAEAARHKGYGSELIERALPYQLGAETRLEFRPDGAYCAITVPLTPKRLETARG